MPLYPGNILTATAATTSGSPAPSRTWQWLRDNVAIPAATNSTYTVTNADLNTLLGVKQTETNFLGADSESSSQVGPVEAYSPSTLFALNEPGVWYDPSDLTTLFQDNLGVSPVTTPGQTVGLMLDKSKGLVLGPELVTNGNFSAGTTGWTPILSSISIVSGALRVSSSDAFARVINTQFTTVVGKTYIATGTATYISGPENLYMYKSDDGAAVNQVATPTTVGGGPKQIVFVATATTTFIAVAHRFSGTVADWDNISVKELPGNHAVQATAASRPLYGIVPRGGRRNLLTWSQDVSNAVWSGANGWSATNSTTVSVSAAGSSVRSIVSGLVTGQTYTLSMDAQKLSGAVTGLSVDLGDGGTAFLGLPTTSVERLTITRVVGASGAFLDLVANGAGSFYLSNIQLELGSTATAYQKVTTQYDVTEAGVQSLSYLAFDGASDSMATGTITPGADKAQVFAGVRKNSDAANGVLIELSVLRAANSGSFTVLAPGGVTAGSEGFGFVSRGTADSSASTTSSLFLAPVTAVMAGLGDISGDVSTLRLNGTQIATSTTDQGTGNYLAYPIYIGARGGTSLFFNGQLFGLITRFGSNLASTNINATEYWLNEKTGAY